MNNDTTTLPPGLAETLLRTHQDSLEDWLHSQFRDTMREALNDIIRQDARKALKEIMEGLAREIFAREFAAQFQHANAGGTVSRLFSSASQAGADLLKTLEKAKRNL